MALLTYRNSIKAAYLTLILAIISIPEIIFELLLELVHILFELIEITLDNLVEHLFHTSLHQTQVIVFYILWSIALLLLYRLKQVLPRYYRNVQTKMSALYVDLKLRFSHYCASLWLAHKI